jgi:hypothetical protein
MEAGIKKISCVIYSHKGWIILKDKKLVGYVWRLSDGDFKWQYQTFSEYGPVGYTNTINSAIEKLISSGWY